MISKSNNPLWFKTESRQPITFAASLRMGIKIESFLLTFAGLFFTTLIVSELSMVKKSAIADSRVISNIN